MLSNFWLLSLADLQVVTCHHRNKQTPIILCQLLSNLYQPIQVFRYDRKLKTIYIQAGMGDEIALIINEDGSWEFVL